MVSYWLMKSEPEAYSIDDLASHKKTLWEGVRNYQARNFMRDHMAVGDLALFYHSNANPSGVAGVCRISATNIPDHTAWDNRSPYFDPKSTRENPRWLMVEVEFLQKLTKLVSLNELRNEPGLAGLKLLEKGSRLSITPLEKNHFDLILELGKQHPI